MTKRITVVLADDVHKKLRTLQAKQISQTSNTVSFSRVINDQLRKFFPNSKK
ncbi:MAG: hypothetical protein O6761_00305 [Thaumarchaeota archaeon]|nr:hypothetical protein [Nitrososphaerota archaeon]